MSKDPAILFYTADFISGTITMTDEQRGKYILLLCIQHQKGFLTEKDMLNICKSYDADIWEKFIQEGDKFYNVRMRVEAEKRAKYSESRKLNRLKKEKDTNISNNICKSYDEHMVNEIENINKDIIEGVQGEAKAKDKKTKYADFVSMLPEEYEKLNSEFGEKGVLRLIEILNNYKGSKGKKYKSDYLAIRNWVVTRYNEEKNKPITASPKNVNQYWDNAN